MSKDKGAKNHKKAPADKSPGTSKSGSDYKNETKGSDKINQVQASDIKSTGKSGNSKT